MIKQNLECGLVKGFCLCKPYCTWNLRCYGWKPEISFMSMKLIHIGLFRDRDSSMCYMRDQFWLEAANLRAILLKIMFTNLQKMYQIF